MNGYDRKRTRRRRRRLRSNLLIVLAVLVIVALVGLAVFVSILYQKQNATSSMEDTSELFATAYQMDGKAYKEDDVQKIQEGITEWARGFLAVDSNINSNERSIVDEGLYGLIADSEDRVKVREDRDSFYGGSEVVVSSVETTINSAEEVKIDGKKLGKIDCTILVNGTRNGETFSRNYSINLLLNYGDIISVYEIEQISWS